MRWSVVCRRAGSATVTDPGATTPEHPAIDVDVLDGPDATERAVRGSAVRAAAYLGATAASALVLPFLFRYLGVVRTGQYVTVLSLTTILAGLVESGLTGISLRIYTQAPNSSRTRLLRDLLSMRIFELAVAIALVLGFATAAGYSNIVLIGVSVTSIGTFLEGIGTAYNVWLAATMRQGAIALSNVARQLVVAIGTLALVLLHAPLLVIFLVFVPAGLAQLVVSGFAARTSQALMPSGDVSAWLSLVRSSSLYVIAMALGFVYFRVPMLITSLDTSPTTTGYFGTAFRIVDTMTLMTIVLTAALPILTRAAGVDAQRYGEGLRRLVQISFVVGAGFSVLVITGAEAAVEILAGPRFSPAIGLLRGLGVVLLLRFVNTTWGYALLSEGRFRDLLAANAAVTVATVVVGATAVPVLGADGGVLATVAAEAGLSLAYGLLMRRRMTVNELPARTIVVVLAAGALGCAVMLIPAPFWITPVIGLALYVALVGVAGELPPEIAGAVSGLRPRSS